MIRSEEEVQAVPSPDPTTIAFKTLTPTGADLGLTCRISFHPSTSQTLHCKLEPGQNMMNHWNPEMLMVSFLKFIPSKILCGIEGGFKQFKI